MLCVCLRSGLCKAENNDQMFIYSYICGVFCTMLCCAGCCLLLHTISYAYLCRNEDHAHEILDLYLLYIPCNVCLCASVFYQLCGIITKRTSLGMVHCYTFMCSVHLCPPCCYMDVPRNRLHKFYTSTHVVGSADTDSWTLAMSRHYFCFIYRYESVWICVRLWCGLIHISPSSPLVVAK